MPATEIAIRPKTPCNEGDTGERSPREALCSTCMILYNFAIFVFVSTGPVKERKPGLQTISIFKISHVEAEEEYTG